MKDPNACTVPPYLFAEIDEHGRTWCITQARIEQQAGAKAYAEQIAENQTANDGGVVVLLMLPVLLLFAVLSRWK